MFFRKLLGSSDGKVEEKKTATPPGMQTMGANLQRKFAKGVQYNMKLILKGDRNVGKTCLFMRLQGKQFKEEYIPTEEIQVANIQWNYKATDDIVKVEVWDVVDKGKKKKKLDGLKLDNGKGDQTNKTDVFGVAADPSLAEDPCLDAEFIDVYQGTHGVIMIMDITKQWTFDYIERELPKIPASIPVLVLANHRDMGHHRVVTEDTVRYFMEELNRGENGGEVRYAEASMRNGFGLKYIHKFFNLPFIQLQRETLLRQLETNKKEMRTVIDELDIHEESEEQNYDLFLDGLTAQRRQVQEKLAETALEKAVTQQQKEEEERIAAEAAAANAVKKAAISAPSTPATSPTGIREAPPARPIPGLQLLTPATGSRPQPVTTSSTIAGSSSPKTKSSMSSSQSAPNIAQSSALPVFEVPSPSPVTTPATTPSAEKASGFMSRWFGKKDKDKDKHDAPDLSNPASLDPVGSIDDFAPDDGLDASFLDDTKDVKGFGSPAKKVGAESSESEGEGGNPLVTGFQDDLDSDDEDTRITTPVTLASKKDLELSSDEEDEGEKQPVITRYEDIDSDPEPVNDSKSISPPKSLPLKNIIKSKTPDASSFVVVEHTQRKTETLLESSQKLTLGNKTGSLRSKGGVSEVDSESDGVDSGNHNAVTVLPDEELSDLEDQSISSSRPTDSGLATDTTQDNDGSQGSNDTKPSTLGLEFEDLSILETGIDSSTGTARSRLSPLGSDLTLSSGRHDTDTDLDSSNSGKKKKKHRSKDKERDKEQDTEKSIKRSKHKKNHSEKDRDRAKEEESEGKDKKKKKSKKKTSGSTEPSRKEMDDLEAFLGGAAEVTTPSGGDYESL